MQKELLEEKARQEVELLEKEQHYNNVQEEVIDCRKIIKKLKQKNKVYQTELKDIHKENAEKNEELLDTVREQAKELDFLNQLVGHLVTEENLYKIKEKTSWDEEMRKWKLAPFVIKQKEVAFPKLGLGAHQFVQDELEKDEIKFNDTRQSDNNTPYQNMGNDRSQRKTNGFKESRNKQRGGVGMNGYRGQNASSSFI